MREIFWAFARKMDTEVAIKQHVMAKKHEDIEIRTPSGHLSFLWDPYGNSTALVTNIDQVRSVENHGDLPALTAVGFGMWHARYLGQDYEQSFKGSLKALAGTTLPNARIAVLPTENSSLLAFAPLQHPFYPALDSLRRTEITPEKITKMNQLLFDQFQTPANWPDIVVWSWAQMLKNSSAAYRSDGIHAIDSVSDWQADVLLNLKCNAQISKQGKYPFDGTCCNSYETLPDLGQRIVVFVTRVMFPFCYMFGTDGKNSARDIRG
jgi:hypothetical protein